VDHGGRHAINARSDDAVDTVDDDLDQDDVVMMPPPASVESRVAARALQASSQAASTVEAGWGGLNLDLGKMSPEALGALREALLEIRDLLA
jgi:hypothetical protein